MREDICTIPINEIFGPKEGCPICRMRDMLEERLTRYITGAAMMEPDVRIETNRLGFCKDHFNGILSVGHRLSLALILESHLHEVEEKVLFSKNDKMAEKKIASAIRDFEKTCFICEQIDKNIEHLMDSTMNMWTNEEEFRQLYEEQPYVCLSHCATLLDASGRVPKKYRKDFVSVTKKLSSKYLDVLQSDTTHFCRMFDYRNADGDWGNSKDAIERSMQYLTSRVPRNDGKADEKNR